MSSHTNKPAPQITAVVLSAAALMSVADARENTLAIVAILQFLKLGCPREAAPCLIGAPDNGDSFHAVFEERDKRFLRRADCFVRNLLTNGPDKVRGQETRLRPKPANKELAGDAGGLSCLGRAAGGGQYRRVWFGCRVTARFASAKASH